jgi:hypothetical protein
MIRLLFVVALACPATAQEPKLVQPKSGNLAAPRAEATKRLAEEVESIEAHHQTKKAYVQATMVAQHAAELTLDRVSKAGIPGAIEDAKLAVNAAKAQVTIREAEANEVAVKLKHAKRRMEENQKADGGTERDKVAAELKGAMGQVKILEETVAGLEKLAALGRATQENVDTARTYLQRWKEVAAVAERKLTQLDKAGQPTDK